MSDLDPNESDLVLGGQNPPPANAAILGGLAGAKQRLKSESIAERLWALNNAVQYGDNAIELALGALTDEAHEVRRLAKRLLRDRLGEVGAKAFLDREPIKYFTTIDDWKQEIYNPETGIVDPQNTAYIVQIHTYLNEGRRSDTYDIRHFEALIADPRVSHLQALIFQINHRSFYFDDLKKFDLFKYIVTLFDTSSHLLVNLRMLCLGDAPIYYWQNYREFERSSFYSSSSRFFIYDICQVLKIFARLTILHIYGNLDNSSNHKKYTLINSFDSCDVTVQHENLRSLIIDGMFSWKANYSISKIALPQLEYLEFWITDSHLCYDICGYLSSTLSGNELLNLRYFGVCNWECKNPSLLKRFLISPIIQQLTVLDFHLGAIADDRDIEYTMSCLGEMQNLKALNLSMNCLSKKAIDRLQQLPFKVIVNNQFKNRSRRQDWLLGQIPF